MRSTLPLLSRTQPAAPSTATPPQPVPTIRLISATPSMTADASTSFSAVAPFASSPLAPRADSEAPRKRLVPKKSKLGLLGSGKTKERVNKDLSDVVRRIGGTTSTGRSGFEIYVDHNEDPEIGEIVVVKKKKSRLGLDGMTWGALGEVTNIPAAKEQKPKPAPVENLLKVKGDENQKWWSIGRGRKDSKEKAKAKESERQKSQVRSKTPEPLKSLDTRAQFNSLDSGIVLSSSASQERLRQPSPTSIPSRAPSPLTAGATLSAVPSDPSRTTNGLLAPEPPASGSIALRAIRSMRSLARMASWAQLTNTNNDINEAARATAPSKTKAKEKEKEAKEKGEGKKKKKKEKEKEAKKKTIRSSGSSFEAGALSAQESPRTVKQESPVRTLRHTKQSVLGLGLPSTLRMSTVRQVSAASSSCAAQPPASNRLSMDSAHLILNANGRPSSVLSSGSSLCPPSTISGGSVISGRSGRSSSSSVVSVRWDEECIRSSKELQRKERRSRREQEGGKTRRESRKTSDARKRTPISEIFPEMQIERPVPTSPPRSMRQPPMVTVEEATADGHSEASLTPVKRARPRPMSEQLLGKARPQAVCESQEGDVLSILDAVTNDLASLINRLDLEATPSSTTNISPLRQTPRAIAGDDSPLRKRTIRDSPLKAELRESTASISSLRPYACTQETANQKSVVKQMIGQSIAPWSTFDCHVSPRKEPTRTVAKARPTHKRTLTPSPAVEPPVFQPLRPAKVKTTNALVTSPSPVATTPLLNCAEPGEPSSGTFGLRSSKHKLRASVDSPTASPTPVFKRTTGLHRKSSSLLAVKSKQSHHSLGNSGIPISPEARMGLGLAGTMGGSGSTEPPVDPEDPDSDIPDELQVILSGQSDEEGERCLDDTLSFRRVSCPTSPREVPLPLPEVPQLSESVETVEAVEVVADAPVFCAQLLDEDANEADIDDGGNGSSEDDTNKSFDFTGELQKLNESGGSDRRSFVEQLENAFRTPARIELGYGLGEHLGLNHNFLAVPPVPALPSAFRHSPAEDVAPRSVSQPGVELSLDEEVPGGLAYGDSMVSAEAQFSIDHAEDHCRAYPELRKSISMRSKASDGQLNVDFKFGGKPDIPDTLEERSERPLTLSDIIPPPEVAYCLSQTSLIEEDSSVLKSIMAQASDLPPPVPRPVPRMRLDSDSSSKRHARDAVLVSRSADSQPAHSRNPSDASFVGFDSFDEIRRGFEFGPDRPTFYPPPGAVSRPTHGRGESVFSIASVSSYGAALNSGALDPFGFGPSRPPSEVSMSVSMSMSVDDTFSFMHRGRNRPRVDSDASSFYFHAPGPAQASLPYRRGHRRHESALSVASNAPPVSLYNRSFGVHKRNDSNTSASSMAQSYAVHGANGGRAAWARHHRQDASVDSQFSDFSAQRLGRPGLGDKMFDNNDYGMPLSAISASPPGSVAEDKLSRRASWDSVLDGGKRSSMDDSLFEKVEDRTSMSSDSVFGYDGRYAYARELPLSQFRPLSVMSEVSTHSPRKEDDTMVTMLDGDHIRRRSLSSMIEASPCTRVERRKPAVGHVRPAAPLFEPIESPLVDSPKVRLAEKPSIASTSSYQFGGERMIMARKGLLERQSLEDSALIAQGEDLLESLRSRSMFSRPDPASRSRSSTCTSSGAETPPLSLSDGSSQSSGSQSSIDLSHLSTLLSTATHPSSGVARVRARARARGTGHRRRISQARASRSSVYETILEEASVAGSPSPAKSLALSSIMSMSPGPVGDSIIVVDGDNDSISKWDDERGIVTLRKYYALRDEAHDTVTESKRTWSDTPFSVFAVQSFRPPNNRGGMQAMLEHSQKNYGSLPSELRLHRIRSRTSSRASPYPLRSVRSSVSPSMSPEQSWPSSAELHVELSAPKELLPPVPPVPSVLREVHVDANTMSPPPAIQPPKPFTPFAIDFDTSKMGKSNLGLPAHPRPRVTSSARRTALGWSKRSTGKSSSNDQKENISQSMVITPSETLRINRPRPRGRPMSARVPVPTA
ncbi:hypothetical protein BKA93DRAFT_870647 [Sparassis latifolia]